MTRSPHFVFFIPDQWRGDVIGHLGNPSARTPHLDRLVDEGAISFRHAFCQNPVCTPSRCSFMTGWYPHTKGHRTMDHLLKKEEPCLLHYLKQAGWQVWWGGKNDLTRDVAGACHIRHHAEPAHANLHVDQSWRPSQEDYSFYVGRLAKNAGEDIYLDADWCHVLEAEQVIANHSSDKPLCLFLTLEYPHPPYGVEEPYYNSIPRETMPTRVSPDSLSEGKPMIQAAIRQRQNLEDRDEAWWTELRATYYGMCSRVDDQFGRIVDALRKAGLYDDTALFFFSDHGDYTGDYGLVEKAQNLFEDCLTRVPLIIKPPASINIRPGIRTGLVELVDIPSTVYDLAGLTPPYTHFGRSLVPQFLNDVPHRDAVFCEGGRLEREPHCAELSANIPGNLYWPRVSIQNESAAAHGKAFMCRTARYKYVWRLTEPDEFYDLEKDPYERHNRIGNPAYELEIKKHRDELLSFLGQTADVVPWTPDARDS